MVRHAEVEPWCAKSQYLRLSAEDSDTAVRLKRTGQEVDLLAHSELLEHRLDINISHLEEFSVLCLCCC